MLRGFLTYGIKDWGGPQIQCFLHKATIKLKGVKGESRHSSAMGNQPKTEQAEKNLFMKMTALRGKNRVSLTVPAAAALLPPQLYDLRGSTGQR